MIIRSYEDSGEQMRMFTQNVYCYICRQWNKFECVEVGDDVTCPNPTCHIKGTLTRGISNRNPLYIGPKGGRDGY
jgi:hypothetical protein